VSVQTAEDVDRWRKVLDRVDQVLLEAKGRRQEHGAIDPVRREVARMDDELFEAWVDLLRGE
jgi:hypothetical protein